MSWPLVKLGLAPLTISDGNYSSKYPKASEFVETGVPFLSGYNLVQGLVDETGCKFISSELHAVLKKGHVKTGDVLITTRGNIGNTAIVPKRLDDANINAQLVLLRPDQSKLSSDYLKHIFNSPSVRRQIETGMTGSALKQLPIRSLKELEIPLPPLDEQKRIAAILDKADAIRGKRQQAIKLADEFLRSIFLDMFGDPVTNPKNWQTNTIKFGLEIIRAGWSAMGHNYPSDIDQLGVLKISAVTSGVFKPEENKFVDPTIIPKDKKLIFPNKGDLLFSRANTRELVAATCIVTKSRSDVFLPDKLWSIKTDTEKLLPEFLHFMVQQPKFKDRLTAQATGTSGSMLNISKPKFEDSISIFPPIELQEKFRNIFWQVNKLTNLSNNSMENLTYNFNSLSQKAFAGEL